MSLECMNRVPFRIDFKVRNNSKSVDDGKSGKYGKCLKNVITDPYAGLTVMKRTRFFVLIFQDFLSDRILWK